MAAHAHRAVDELRRIFTTYATDVMGFAPFSGPVENVPLVDLEGARRAWISEGSFADGELAVQLIARRKRRVEEFEAEAYERRVRIRREIENQNPGEREYFVDRKVEEATAGDTAYDVLGPSKIDTAFKGAFSESRTSCVRSVALRRAMALGFDPRTGEPAELDPRKPDDDDDDDAAAANVERVMDLHFGSNASDWSFDKDPRDGEKWIGRVFAHCGPSKAGSPDIRVNTATPADDGETELLKFYAPKQRAWRMTLLRATGSHMPHVDAETAYVEFRRIWRACHPPKDGFLMNPPDDYCAERGGDVFDEILADRRTRIGSFAVEFLWSAVRALPGAHDHASDIDGDDDAAETKLWNMWRKISKQGCA